MAQFIFLRERERKRRPVQITLENGMYFVRYQDRRPRGRHFAGQFDARDSSREQVEAWVVSQKHLRFA